MRILNNPKLMNYYIEKYNIDNIFEDKLLKEAQLHLFKKGELICRVGDYLTFFYLLVSGKTKVYTILRNGKSLLLRICEPFNNFGDIEVLEQSHIKTNVEALSETLCIGISLDLIRNNCLDNPSFLKYICSTLSEKLDSFSYRSSINLMYPLKNRLASYLAAHLNNNEEFITLTSSYSDIADLLGASYRHLQRTIKELCNMGIISIEDKNILIHDKKALEELGEDLYR
jgi:CRP-like cAMP-binding protein